MCFPDFPEFLLLMMKVKVLEFIFEQKIGDKFPSVPIQTGLSSQFSSSTFD